ncbi:glycerophosphodiester phosphodiesterase [Ideonella sp.]|uniref:glycerophosphodiester phosphodiesterase n=1 Tax=Ideonella sp. TaxID=1929293 RepID=UPI002B474112|nr:glycerophosphodiester phosphodiesterase [Ideonella sp.]HJV68810.1 glycerophosphodiester phosphodiesterase [Ideonella sp.]
MTTLPDWPHPRWIAHRGAGKLAPENTLAAFRLGASHGYRAFECDVKLSADDVPFLLHDDTLDRTTTDAQGRAADRPWGALSRLDAGGWHSAAYAGEPLASLQAVATWLRRNRAWLDLEIKPTEGDEERTGRIVATEVARLWAGDATPPLLSSFRPESLAGARDAAPGLARALLVDTDWPGWLDLALQLGCVAAITNHQLMDAALLARLHQAGLRALVYTVNDPVRASELLAIGIDGIITDAVDRFAPG